MTFFTFHIYSERNGHDSIAIRFLDSKYRFPKTVYRDGVAFDRTGYTYKAENRDQALQKYYDA